MRNHCIQKSRYDDPIDYRRMMVDDARASSDELRPDFKGAHLIRLTIDGLFDHHIRYAGMCALPGRPRLKFSTSFNRHRHRSDPSHAARLQLEARSLAHVIVQFSINLSSDRSVARSVHRSVVLSI